MEARKTQTWKSKQSVASGDLIMLRWDNKNEQAQFGLVLELLNQNRDAVFKLQSGYSFVTATRNLILVASGQSDRMDQQGSMNRVGKKFSHFISASITGDGDRDLIKKYQEKLGEVPGIGKAKNPKKMQPI